MLNSSRSIRFAAGAVAALALAAALLYDVNSAPLIEPTQPGTPVGVLGDSDSHSYQDRLTFPSGSSARGGSHRATSFQWTEVLGRLRSEPLDLGPWGEWGSRGSLARMSEWLGRPARAPRKEDYRHNFAVSGAVCADLMEGGWRQAPRLLQLMGTAPARWANGIVVIRVGVNSFGREADLDRLARDPADPAVRGQIDRCLGHIEDSISLIRNAHPGMRFVLVGIFDNTHWARYAGRWQDPSALRNIGAGLDRFDHGLRRLADQRPGIAFFDDRAWFARHWGGRDAQGRPAYRSVPLEGIGSVSNTAGDDPRHAVLADGHAGTVWNGLWARALVEVMNRSFGLNVEPILDGEIAALLRASGG